MKKYVLFLVCMFLFVAAGGEVSGKQRSVAVGGTPAIECTSLTVAFNYPNTTLTSVTLAAEGSVVVAGIGPMPEHCIVKGKMNERVSPVDGKTYAIGFEMRLPTNWNGRFFYQGNGGTDGSSRLLMGIFSVGGRPATGSSKGLQSSALMPATPLSPADRRRSFRHRSAGTHSTMATTR